MIITELPLLRDAAYQYNLNIDGSTKTFSFSINVRENALHMDVSEGANVLQTGLRVLPKNILRVSGIFGFFVLMPKKAGQVFLEIGSVINIPTYYSLVYYPFE